MGRWVNDLYQYLSRKEVVFTPSASELDQGVLGDEVTIKRIVDTVGTDKTVTIKLRHDPVNGDTTSYIFKTTDVIPGNIFIDLDPGALIKDTTDDADLTINGPIIAEPDQQIFDWGNGSGVLTIGKGLVYVGWFGAVGDCTGVGVGTDDSIATQTAFDAVDGSAYSTVIFPPGHRYRVSNTCTINWSGKYGGSLIMNSPMTPDVVVGNAFEILDGRYITLDLWVRDGGTLKDYSIADPSDAEQAFLIRGIRDATIDVKGDNYKGRVCRVSKEGAGEEKTSKLQFKSFNTGTSGTGCGQSIYIDATSAFGGFGDMKLFYDEYGPVFYETHDITIQLMDTIFQGNSGVVVSGCQSFWADVFSLGDETQTVDLLTINDGSLLHSANIHINSLFANKGKNGVVLTNIGLDYDVGSLIIDACMTRDNGEHGVYITDCRGMKLGVDSVEDEIGVEIVGASSRNLFIDLRSLSAKKQALIVGASAYQLEFTGVVQNANRSETATTSAVDINSTGRDIEFNSFTIEEATGYPEYLIDIVSSNNVVLNGGHFLVSAGATIIMNNAPKVARGVRGYKTEATGVATVLNGNTTIAVSHGLDITPTSVILTGTEAETNALWVTAIGSSTFTINVSGAVSANRDVYWSANGLLSQD
ncbi:hypothetical protein DRQ25_16810 [Candidatus Fermentibacteria bacterium]|nr:MAG: hypothetical protein DRQ25_16810 [Candidatus Fermentibacteria bacterium]